MFDCAQTLPQDGSRLNPTNEGFMGLFSIEQSKAAYRADIAFYAVSVVILTAWLLLRGPPAHWLQLVGYALAGLSGWTAIEYGLHRFVLHGLKPFSRWHVLHHQRPSALMFTPTPVSASLIAALVFLPALLASELWPASALTLGVLIGYLAYTVTHHATHHWHADSAWLRRRKRWHALHHHRGAQSVCYGVSTAFWDRVFGSTSRTEQASA
jgi:cyclopropane-fatty-acyl-phospholipid synthase